MSIKSQATRTSASPRRAKAIPGGFRKHTSWWRSQVPKLIAQFNAVLANAEEPQGPRALLIEPRFVSFPLQSDLAGEMMRSKMGEIRYGRTLPPSVTLGDIGKALQGEGLPHLVAAHLLLQEADAISLCSPDGMENPAVSLLTEHMSAAVEDFSAEVERISTSKS